MLNKNKKYYFLSAYFAAGPEKEKLGTGASLPLFYFWYRSCFMYFPHTRLTGFVYVPIFYRAAVSKCHKLTVSNNSYLLSHSCGGWKSEIKVAFRAIVFLQHYGRLILAFLLRQGTLGFWQHDSNLCVMFSLCACLLFIFSPSDVLKVGAYLLHYDFILTRSLAILFPNEVTFWGTGNYGLQHMNKFDP